MSNKSATTNSSICRKLISRWCLTGGLLVFLTALFFGPITDYYHSSLPFLFHPWLQILLDRDHLCRGLLLFALAFIFIMLFWISTILKPKHPTPIGPLIGKVAVLVSLHYLMIRILPVFDQHVFVLPWSFLPLGSSWFKYSDIALLPGVLGLLHEVKYFVKNNLPSVFERLKRELYERLVLLRRLVKYPFFYSFRSKGIIEPPANQPDFPWEEDCPIENYKDDAFNRKVLVNEIVERIVKWSPEQSSFNISITGEWGSGKTSFLNMVKNQLQERAVVVDYVPWSYHHPTDLTAQFFELLANALEKESTYRDLAATIRSAAVGTGFWGNLMAQILDYPRSYTALKERIETSLKHTNGKRLVIVVDELDRLTADELTEVLKLLKNLGSIKGSYIITSFDKEAIAANLGQIKDGNKYLEKFFQAEVPLAKISVSHTIGKDLIAWMKILGIDQDVIQQIEETFRYSDGFKLKPKEDSHYYIWQLIDNSRKLKLFINSVNTRFPLIREKIDVYSFLLLELIRLYYPKVYQMLARKECLGISEKTETKYQYLSKRLQIHLLLSTLKRKSEKEKEDLDNVLTYLFPGDGKQRPANGPNCVYFFEFYVSDYLYRKVDLYKLTTLRKDHHDVELVKAIEEQSQESETSEIAINNYMSDYSINTPEDLYTELRLLLRLGDRYATHSDKVIQSLSEIENSLTYSRLHLEEKIKSILIENCYDNECSLFGKWLVQAKLRDERAAISHSRLIDIFIQRLDRYYSKALKMHTIHALVNELISIRLASDQYENLKNGFMNKLNSDEKFALRYLKYCIQILEQTSADKPKLTYKESNDALSFYTVKSVQLFEEWSKFLKFVKNCETRKENLALSGVAKRVLMYIGHFKLTGRSINESLVVRIPYDKQYDYGIFPEDMDPVVFKDVDLPVVINDIKIIQD